MGKTLKEKIKDLRIANQYTEEYVAKYLGTTQAVIWKYESGRTEKIPMDVIRKLCLLYGVSADYLLGLPQGLKFPEE